MSIRKRLLKLVLLSLSGTAISVTTLAAGLSLSVEVPRLQVAEYHRPYIAAWLQQPGSREVINLAVWYQLDDKQEGNKWLKDMRQWWRRSGRSLSMPVDGFSGATRPPGVHRVELNDVAQQLVAGEYRLYVEAAREVGGRELLTLPFRWPVSKAESLSVAGEDELGQVELTLTP